VSKDLDESEEWKEASESDSDSERESESLYEDDMTLKPGSEYAEEESSDPKL